MRASMSFHSSKLALVVSLFVAGCGDDGGGADDAGGGTGNGGTTSTGGTSPTGGPATGGTAGVPTPEGMLFMDDFEGGSSKWSITQGTCSVMADDTNVLNCLNGGNEARAVAGEVWGEYSVQARVKVSSMEPDRRIYLAGRF